MPAAAFQVVIPARYGSSRLPGKPLLDIGGKPMIQWVVEGASRSAAAAVVVATDCAAIASAVEAFGGVAVMTSARHQCGADRIVEAIDKLGWAAGDVVVNVQGDEPQMPPPLIDQVAALAARGAAMATASAPLQHAAQLTDPAVVKVVVDRAGRALYFSRAAIPWQRAGLPPGLATSVEAVAEAAAEAATSVEATAARRHIGIYAYRCDYLRRFTGYGVCALEAAERLEQLRALWHGDRIACAEAVDIPPPGVDTPADLARVRAEMGG